MGRGPHEAYPDRKASALVRQYSLAVQDMHVPYVFPQESGGRADVRWVLLTQGSERGAGSMLPAGDARSKGLRSSLAVWASRGSRPMQMSASR